MSEKTKSFFGNLKDLKIIHYIIIAICVLIMSLKLLNFSVANTHDGDFHLMKVMGTAIDIKNGQLPSMVLSKYCNDGGYAMNAFYPIFTAYIPLIFKLFTKSCENCLKIFAVVSMFISSIAMYELTKEIISNNSKQNKNKEIIALISAILYLVFPYKLGNIYIRFAIGEFAAVMFLPLLFLGLYNILYKNGDKHYYLTIGAAGLILTHTITTVYAAFFSVIILVVNYKRLKEIEVIKKLLINGIFTILIGLMFLVPIIEFRTFGNYTLFNKGLMRTNNEYVQNNTIVVTELFRQTANEELVDEKIEARIGLPILVFMIAIVFKMKEIIKEQTNIFPVFLIFALISLFMCIDTFPWLIMPEFMAMLQYPWRMLGFFILFISPIGSVSIYMIFEKFIKEDKIKILCTIELIVLLLIYTQIFIISSYKQDINEEIYEKYQQFEQIIGERKELSHMAINRDYLPEKSLRKQYDYVEEREPDKLVVLYDAKKINEEEINPQNKGNKIEIFDEKKDHLKMSSKIKNATKGTIIETPYFYYPGYEISVRDLDVEEVGVEYFESENGYISIKLESDIEDGEIKIEYKGTLLEKISYIISLSTIVIFIIFVLMEKNKRS